MAPLSESFVTSEDCPKLEGRPDFAVFGGQNENHGGGARRGIASRGVGAEDSRSPGFCGRAGTNRSPLGRDCKCDCSGAGFLRAEGGTPPGGIATADDAVAHFG